MKRIAIASSVAALLCSAASAQDFSGFYAGASVHLGSGNDVFVDETLSRIDDVHTHHYARLNAPSIGVFGGFNNRAEWGVWGIELSFRGDASPSSTNEHSVELRTPGYYPVDLMASIAELHASGTSGTATVNVGTYEMGVKEQAWTDLREEISPMLSARMGIPIGNTLFYGRAGIGGSLMTVSKNYRFSSIVCADGGQTTVSYTPTEYSFHFPSCREKGAINLESSKAEKSRFVPAFAAAVGAEYHHGQYFGRAELEARYIHWGDDFLPSGESGAMRYQLGLGFGVRF